MNHTENYKEIVGEVENMARWLSRGRLGPGHFCLLLNTLEKQKLERFGIVLNSRISLEGVVHFSLRIADSHELCASMDVDLFTGKLSTQIAHP